MIANNETLFDLYNASEKIVGADGKMKILIEDEVLKKLIDEYSQAI